MSWDTISETDVLARLSRQEVEAYRAQPMDGGTDDPLSEIIAGAVAEARGRIAAHSANRLDDTTTTVPDSVVHHLLAIIRYRLLTRLPLRVTEARRKEYEDALDFLKAIARGEVAIEDPDGDGTGESVAPAAVVVESRSTRITGAQMAGL